MPHTIINYNPFARSVRHDRVPPEVAKALPVALDFPIPTHVGSQRPVDWALAYLMTFDPAGRPRNGNYPRRTVLAYANDLKPLADLLEHEGVAFSNMQQSSVDRFFDLQVKFRSPASGDFLSHRTIARRLGTVLQAATTATAVHDGRTTINITPLLRKLGGAEMFDDGNDDELPSPREARREQSKCMTAEHWQAIRDELGPLPSEIAPGDNDPAPTRDRLESELAVSTGMREDEVANFPLRLLSAINPSDLAQGGYTRFRLKKTKRLRKRWVFVPNWMVTELLLYVGSERAAAVIRGRELWGDAYVEPTTVFVNGSNAGDDAGHARKPEAVGAAFRDAVRAAGLTVPAGVVKMGERRIVLMPQYSFHSHRHSFALWLYFILEERFPGRDNWAIIRARLGHKRKSTTIESYGDVSKSLEFFVGDLINEAVRNSILAA